MARSRSPFQVNVARDGVIVTVAIRGELDITTAEELRESLTGLSAIGLKASALVGWEAMWLLAPGRVR